MRHLWIIPAMPLVITAVGCGGAGTARGCPARPVIHRPPIEYFEPGSLGKSPIYLDQFRLDLAKTLWAMGEPSLLHEANRQSAEAYRLLMFPAPHGLGPSLAIRVEETPTGAQLTWASLERSPASEFERPENAPNSPEPAIPMRCATENVSSADWRSISECIERNAFWAASTGEPVLQQFDGSTRVLEGVKNGRHHFILRKSHDRSPDEFGMRLVTECGNIMLKLASLR